MAELDPNLNRTPQEEQQEEKQPSYTPASFEKRTATWMGIAYMVMLVFIITFAISTGGNQLPGTFPLFLVPVCIAAAVIAVYRQVKKVSPLPLTILLLVCCAAGVVLGLALGVPALVAALQNPYGL